MQPAPEGMNASRVSTIPASKLRWSLAGRKALFAILLLALVLRAAYSLWLGPEIYSWDGRVYDQIARNLLSGSGFNYSPGFNESFRPPLYPFFLAAVYAAVGDSLIIIRLLQALIGTLTCLVAYLIGKRIEGHRLGLTTAGIVAVHPWLIWYTREVMSETLFTLLLSLAVLFMLRIPENGGRRSAIAVGIFTGLAALAKPAALLLPIVAGVWLLLTRRTLRQAWMPLTIMVIVTFATIAPWTIRNYLTLGNPVLISTNGGSNFYLGNHAGIPDDLLANARNMNVLFSTPPLTQEQHQKLDGLTEVERESQFYSWAFEFIRANPERFFFMLKEKLTIYWSVTREVPLERFENLTGGHESTARILRGLIVSFEYLLFMGAGVGLIVSFARGQTWSVLIALVLLYFTAVHVLYFPEARFRLPLAPLLALPAAWTALALARFLPPNQHHRNRQDAAQAPKGRA